MVNVDNRGTGPRDPRGSNSSLYFIVGALVLAVLIIGWFMYGGNDADTAGTGAGDVNVTTEEPAAGDTNVTVEEVPATPAAGDTNVTVETPAAPPAVPDVVVEPPPADAAPADAAPADAPPAGDAAGGTEPAPAPAPAQ